MTASERAAFLAKILDGPADDTNRLVYADALRESPDPFDQLHGRFIWAGVTLSRFRGHDPATDGMFFDAIKDQAEAGERVLEVQLRHLLGWDRLTTPWAWDNDATVPDRVTARAIPPTAEALTPRERRARRRNPLPMPAVVWERGCVTALRLPLETWQRGAARFLQTCPIERIELIAFKGLTLRVEHDELNWRLGAELSLPAAPTGTLAAGADGLNAIAPARPAHTIREQWPAGGDPGFASRDPLVDLLGPATVIVLTCLRTQAGDRWPGPPSDRGQDDGQGEAGIGQGDRPDREAVDGDNMVP